MTDTSGAMGTVEAALVHAERLLDRSPALAEEQAGEILKVVPNHPLAALVLGAARRRQSDPAGALRALEPLCAARPDWPAAHYERGLALAADAQPEASLAALRRAVSLEPNLPDAWRAIGDHLITNGDLAGADAAYAQHIKASTRDPRLLVAAAALVDGRIAEAEHLLRSHLKQRPTDVVAIRMLAEVAARLGRNAAAESLLESCLELAPSFSPARHQYAIILHRQNKSAAALQQIDQLEAVDPHNVSYRNLKAVTLVKIGEYQESIKIYAEVLAAHPEHPKLWLSYAHALATAGSEQDSAAAYRRCIGLSPDMGEAYWSLANLKTFRFTVEDKLAMRAQLGRRDLSEEARYHFDFAMGKALEDDGDYRASFTHYANANRLRNAGLNYDAEEMSRFVRRSADLLTAEFFAGREGFGAPSADPIFIVGLPRAGSTLIEQILASHSLVEGTMELPDMLMIAGTLAGQKESSEGPKYPAILGTLTAAEALALGQQYLVQTRIQRKTQKPFFIDKMPNNFLHVGLIRLTLPNAKIIDARRHPMACCFSGFKQQFAEGHRYAYDLADLGRYYRDYVELMDHFDGVIPGKIHRVIYENMIDDTEAEIRRLLSFCGLHFESACLRFYENDRPVRTPSAQQVRKPIYRDGVEHWRRYEQWLEPLKLALGDVLDVYPGTPRFQNHAKCGIQSSGEVARTKI
jgi:tetratricopeptide (TPR) repeat protein